MKTPLRYQMTEYDCVPTTFMNAVSYLFDREEIPPELVRSIMIYCLDTHGHNGHCGEDGTSRMAIHFLSSWMNEFGKSRQVPVKAVYLEGEEVYVGEKGQINAALEEGGVALVRLYHMKTGHYVLFTKDLGDRVQIFDPYLYELTPEFSDWEKIEAIKDAPFSCNYIMPYELFNRETNENYALGEMDKREAVLLFKEDTVLFE